MRTGRNVVVAARRWVEFADARYIAETTASVNSAVGTARLGCPFKIISF